MNRYKILSALVAMALAVPFASTAEARYSSDSDTAISILDYLENKHREERENRLTAAQEQLLVDAKNLAKSLRYPVDPAKVVPVAFEGEDLTYDERDGSFVARGRVDILQADAHRFTGDDVTGNTQTQEIHMPAAGQVMQMTEGAMRLTLDGYRINYNYGQQTGDMEDVTGKAGPNYITGKRFEFYADHYVAYNGTVTKCGAKNPDYHWEAEKVTIYPNDKMVLENVSFWIKGMKIFSKKKHTSNISPEAASPTFPRLGYDSDKGAYLTYPVNVPVRKNVNLTGTLEVNKEYGWRPHYDLGWRNRSLALGVRYGYYEDSDDNWIKKEPSGYMSYGRPIGKTHFNYSLSTEYGRWYGTGNHIHSNHWYYGASLSHDPIVFGGYRLLLSGGYGVTRESYDDSRTSGWSYSARIVRDFDPRWSAYVGYYYDYSNSKNSLFDYDSDDFSRKLKAGFSYRFDDLNRVAVGTRYDLDNSKWNDIDYYWFHDMHCAQLITRYRSLSNQWHFSLQFIPW